MGPADGGLKLLPLKEGDSDFKKVARRPGGLVVGWLLGGWLVGLFYLDIVMIGMKNPLVDHSFCNRFLSLVLHCLCVMGYVFYLSRHRQKAANRSPFSPAAGGG